MSHDSSTRVHQATQPRRFSIAWFLAGSGLHLFLWFAVLAYFYLYVPYRKEVFADFGIDLPEATLLIISLSDLIVSYWYLLLPTAVPVVLVLNAAIVALTYSRGWRVGLILLFATMPITWIITSHVLLKIPMDQLIEQLQ